MLYNRDMELAKQIGNRIRTARIEKRITQEEAGKVLGIGRAGYANIENGRSLITVEHLLKLPPILGRPVTYFLGLESPTSVPVSDSAKIDAIWKAVQQQEKIPVSRSIILPDQSHPDKEVLGEVWDKLDALERHAVYDYALWRLEEQEKRRDSDDEIQKTKAAREEEINRAIEHLDLLITIDEADPLHVQRIIARLQQKLTPPQKD